MLLSVQSAVRNQSMQAAERDQMVAELSDLSSKVMGAMEEGLPLALHLEVIRCTRCAALTVAAATSGSVGSPES